MSNLTFDDVALIQPFSSVLSRTSPSLRTRLTKRYDINIPILNSPMDSVISLELAKVLSEYGSIPIFHREFPLDQLKDYEEQFFISVGVELDINTIRSLADNNPALIGINVDVANGHSLISLNTITQLKELLPGYEIMGGCVCTRWGYRDLVNAGSDVVRAGIGTGSSCNTRGVTGVGTPQFSTLLEIHKDVKRMGVPVISDGGIRTSSDIVKALVAGASSVMIGNLFAGTVESAAKKRNNPFGKLEAFYRGQASESYQVDNYGFVRTAPEGESAWIPCDYAANTLLDLLCGGVKNSMAYMDSLTIEHLTYTAEWQEVSNSYREESRVRI